MKESEIASRLRPLFDEHLNFTNPRDLEGLVRLGMTGGKSAVAATEDAWESASKSLLGVPLAKIAEALGIEVEPDKPETRTPWDGLSEAIQGRLAILADGHQIRNGVLQADGSRGEMRITPGQMRATVRKAYDLGRSAEAVAHPVMPRDASAGTHSRESLRFLVDLLCGLGRQFAGRLLAPGRAAGWPLTARHREIVFDPADQAPGWISQRILEDAAEFGGAGRVRFYTLAATPQPLGVVCHAITDPVGAAARVRVWMDFPNTVKWSVDYVISPVSDGAIDSAASL